MALDTIAAGLYSPGNSAGGSLAAAASPALAQQIGVYFKDLAAQNQDGKLHNSQQAAHVLAHGILAAAVAAAGGNDALSAGMAAGGAEAAAPAVAKWLYGTDDPDKLSAEQKSTVSAIAGLGGAALGTVGGTSATDAVSGSQVAQNAVENNQYAVTRYRNRVNLYENIAEVTDPFGVLQPLLEIKAATDQINHLKKIEETKRQDKINENIQKYLAKNGVHVELRDGLFNENGVGVTRPDTEGNRKVLVKALQDFAQSTVSTHATFRAAKTKLGIPVTMQPTAVRRVPIIERNSITGLEQNKKDMLGNVIYANEYLFTHNGKNYIIQNHSVGHNFYTQSGVGNQSGHFNLKQIEIQSHEINQEIDVTRWKNEKMVPHNKQTYETIKITGIPEHLYTKPSINANPKEPFFKKLTVPVIKRK